LSPQNGGFIRAFWIAGCAGSARIVCFFNKVCKNNYIELEVEKSFLKEFFCLKTITVVFYENK
jgi:hypothetical protein